MLVANITIIAIVLKFPKTLGTVFPHYVAVHSLADFI